MTRVEVDISCPRGDFALRLAFGAESGEVTSVFGRSGSGKTTLLLALAGHLRARGKIRVGDEVWLDSEKDIDLPPHRRAVGWVSQESDLFGHLDVRGNLLFGQIRLPVAERVLGLDEVARDLGLQGLLDRRVAGLSGGERQRVALGRALLRAPHLLLLDEPLAALDGESRAILVERLDELRERFAWPVLLVSHSIREVARLADRMLLMREGSIEASGTASELLTSFAVDRLAGEDSGAVLEAALAAQEDDGLSRLDTGAGPILVRRLDRPIGTRLRLQILASDVSLATGPVTNDSVLNSLAGRVEAVEILSEGAAVVRVRCGEKGPAILARITRRSLARLGLTVGSPVEARVKAVSVLD